MFFALLVLLITVAESTGVHASISLVDETALRVRCNVSTHVHAQGIHIDRYYPLTQEYTLYATADAEDALIHADCSVKHEPSARSSRSGSSDGYISNAAINAHLRLVAAMHSDVARVHVIGYSVLGVEILAIEISRDVFDRVTVAKPAVKLVANMHGDEVVGRELLVRLVDHLIENRNFDTGDIVDGVRIFIVPTMNPDGFARGRRSNAYYMDLNRDFPDPWLDDAALSLDDRRQPETIAIMQLSRDIPLLTLSANMHGGAVVANYPYDGNQETRSGVYSATPDDKLFRMLARTYASRNPEMAASREFPGGITNGADWYVLYHGMQDWNYEYRRVFGITLELSERKWPYASTLDGYWSNNRDALLAYVRLPLHTGIHGRVSKHVANDTSPSECIAQISVTDIDNNRLMDTYSDPATNAYHRLLPPGQFLVTAATSQCAPLQTRVDIDVDQDELVSVSFVFADCVL